MSGLDELPRLDSDALGPCIVCDRVMLATGLPLFYRVKSKRCGIDAKEVRRHVGLAQSIAPGTAGLALAAVIGPKVEPVVVLDDWPEMNVCMACAGSTPFDQVLLLAMEKVRG